MNQNIIDKLHQIVERAIEVLNVLDPNTLRPRVRKQLEIVDSQRSSLHEEIEPDYLILNIHLSEVLLKDPLATDLRSMVESDPIIGPQMNTLVGTKEGARHLSSDELLRHVLWAYFNRVKYSTVLDEIAFDAICENLSNAFTSTDVTFSYQTVLENFKMTQAISVTITPGLILRGLIPKEVENLWNGDQTLQHRYSFYGFGLHVSSISAVLETTRVTTKVIGSDDVKQVDQKTLPTANVRADFDHVIAALRMMKSGAARTGLIMKKSDSPWDVQSASWTGAAMSSLFTPVLEFDPAQDTALLKSMFESIRLAEQQNKGALLVGVRRIGYSSERPIEEDSLLDIMIALEAFVLNDISTAQERGELRFRLALYIAKLLGGNAEEQGRVHRLVRKAYDLRSEVVHGGTFDQKKKETVKDIAEIARRVGQKLLIMNSKGEKPDWDQLLGLKA